MKRIQIPDLPRQFWVLLGGTIINEAGTSMVWPFLTIYLRRHVEVPMATIGLLLAASSVARLLTVLVAGPVVDRFGRKGVMLLSMLGSALTYALMIPARGLAAWSVLIIVRGGLQPFFSVGADAMLADLLPTERRKEGYALVRMAANLGIAIGPAVGGLVTALSYNLAFGIAAASGFFFLLLILRLVSETLPRREPGAAPIAGAAAGFGPVLRDRRFLAFFVASTLAIVPSTLMMSMLPVYANEQYGMPESQYGLIMTTNAALVVLFQYAVTRRTRRYRPLPVMATGALIYALGVGSVALGRGFWAFWSSMVLLTAGELVLMPTASAWVADAAPADMRGRYMGVFSLSWGIALGIGPLLGGWLSDAIAPAAMWVGGLAAGLLAMLGYLLLARRSPAPAPAEA